MKRLGVKPILAKSFNHLMTSLPILQRHLRECPRIDIQVYSNEYAQACARLFEASRRDMDLSQVWTSHQMDHVLGHRPGTKTWVWMDGPCARALVKALRVRVLDEKTVETAHLEHVLIRHLSLPEWSCFFASIIDDPFWDGIQAIYVPMTGHVNPSMFLEWGFYQTPKAFGLFNVPLDEKAILEPVRRFQMEVF